MLRYCPFVHPKEYLNGHIKEFLTKLETNDIEELTVRMNGHLKAIKDDNFKSFLKRCIKNCVKVLSDLR